MISEREVGSPYSNTEQRGKSFLPLDVSSLLVHNSLLHHEVREAGRPTPLEPREGFDNVAFDLEGLEKVQPGSRKPLVALHVRTVSAEEFVRSTLSNQGSHSRNLREWGTITSYPPPNSLFSQMREQNMQRQQDPGIGVDLQISDKSFPHSHKPHCDQHNLQNNKSHITKFPSFKNIKSYSLNVHQSSKENGVKGNYNDDNSNLYNEKNRQQKLVTKNNKKESSFRISQGQPLNISRHESLPSNAVLNKKKTDVVLRAKKTGGGLTLSGRENDGTSLAKTMVRVGGVSTAISPPFTPNAVVSSPLKVVISSVGPISTSTNVSQVSVMSGAVVGVNTTATKVSNVVLNHANGGGLLHLSAPTTSTLAPSVVSALSKVSSVRIVPSPNNTPTPSVIGVSTSSGVHSPETPGPASPTRAITPSFVKSSHTCRPLEVVKRHITNIRNHEQPHQQPLTIITTNQSGSNQRSSNPQQEQHQHLLDLPHSGLVTIQPTNDINQTITSQVTPQSGQPQTSDLLIHQQPLLTSEPPAELKQHEQVGSPQVPQPQPDPLRGTGQPPEEGTANAQTNAPSNQIPESVRREGRERRRERRERRRERRALRILGGPAGPPGVPVQTELGPEPRPIPHHHLPDLLNSHIPPPYSTLTNGPRTLGGLLGPPAVGVPPPIPLQMPPPPAPVPPLPPLGPFPPAGATHASPVRPPIPENPWHFFGSRR